MSARCAQARPGTKRVPAIIGSAWRPGVPPFLLLQLSQQPPRWDDRASFSKAVMARIYGCFLDTVRCAANHPLSTLANRLAHQDTYPMAPKGPPRPPLTLTARKALSSPR